MRFLLVDDHTIVISGLKIILKDAFPGAQFDATFSEQKIYELLRENKYDIIIIDINMPGIDSTGLLLNILNRDPKAKVIVFSMNPEEIFAMRLLKLGAKGYVSKEASSEEIVRAINVVLSDKNYFSERMIQKISEDIIYKRTENPFDKLSEREFEVARLLVKGVSRLEVCNTLNLHSSTIGTHKAKIFDKLGVRNIVELRELAKLNNIPVN